MQTAIFSAAMIFGMLLFLGLRLTKSSQRNGQTRDRRSGFGASNPFHAVSIAPSEEGCPAVEAIKKQRFLSEDAPGLPLADCGAADCGCKYVHFADRRSGARDRRFGSADHADETEFWRLRERRAVSGRRHEDRQAA